MIDIGMAENRIMIMCLLGFYDIFFTFYIRLASNVNDGINALQLQLIKSSTLLSP